VICKIFQSVVIKKVLIISCLMVLPLLGFGQGPISFGPKIGFNSTRVSTAYEDYVEEMKNGVQGGVFFSIYMNKFYIQPEAYFSIKSGELETTIGDPLNISETIDVSQSYSLTTVDIPMLLGYKILDLKLARFRVWGGPVASYVLDKEYTLSLNKEEVHSGISMADFKDAIWGAQIGAGLDILFLTFDIGYEFGLEEFLNISSLNDLGLTNNTFYVSLGWRIF